MKTPVCEEDIREGRLCSECEKKISKGDLSALDFEVARLLARINQRRNLTAASFTRCIDLGRMVVIFTEGEPGVLIGRNGTVVSELSHALGKRVRIAQSSSDARKTIADLLAPAKILGINTMYHEGVQNTKVRIEKGSIQSLPADLDTLGKAIKTVLKQDVTIVFE
ncbi:NusA-like KH domain protein [Candidatus Anstonella stagnisolia]|nr:NusA-like KH domain protein [Candidatus Anstonella stagnisolia]